MKKCILNVLAGLAVLWAVGTVSATDSGNREIQRAVFKVENLTCGGCFYTINNGLKPLEGFSGMGANLFRNLVAVDFVAPLTPDAIREAISGLGYPAVVQSVEPVTEQEAFAGRSSGGCCGGGYGAGAQVQGACPGKAGSKGCPYVPGSVESNTQKL